MRLLSVLCLLSCCLACNAQSGDYIRLNADAFEKKLDTTNIQLLDVRTSVEFKEGHISQALQADWNNRSQFAERTAALKKNEPLYIYCLAGGRSTAAAKWLQEQGFTNIIELEGGINSWKKSGKPLEDLVVKNGMNMNQYLAAVIGNKTVLVDIGATWCAPCKAMTPVLDSLTNDKSLHFELLKIDADANTEIMKELDITTIPVFIIYKNGKEIFKHVGMIGFSEIRKNLL